MEMFNYVMVLASVIIGLGITHLLQGVGRIVQHPGREKTYWVHLLWVAAIFLRAIFWWWFEFRLSKIAEWTFTQTADELLDRLHDGGVPAGRIYRAKDMFADPHFAARAA